MQHLKMQRVVQIAQVNPYWSKWIDYRTFYGECPLKELLGGNFVIVNEHLQKGV